MYRINIPSRLEGGDYAIDVVDPPVGRWNAQGRESLWILHDGNHDGLYDRKFGDILLGDVAGQGFIDLTAGSPNLFSFHAPLELPWGAFTVSQIDPGGQFITLRGIVGFNAEKLRPLEVGDAVPAEQCRTLDGRTVVIGGATKQTQLVYFWLSHCGTCRTSMDALSGLLRELQSEDIAAVGVSLDESKDAFRSFMNERVVLWPQCFSGKMMSDNALARRFGVHDPSELVVIGPDGRLAAKLKKVTELRGELGRLGLVGKVEGGR